MVQRIIENEGHEEHNGDHDFLEEGSNHHNLASSPGLHVEGGFIEEDVRGQLEPSQSIVLNRRTRLE